MDKTYRRLPYILLFSCFLLIGFSIGRGAYTDPAGSWASEGISGSNTSRAIQTPSAAASNQRNILVIGVDDLDARQPRLESIWLVIYLIDHPQMFLLPIYPPPPESGRAGEADPHRPTLDPQTQTRLYSELFRVARDGSPDPDFLEALQAKNIWWSGYIMVDEFGLAEVVETAMKLSEADLDGTSAVRAVAEIPPPWVDPQGSLPGQVELARTICRYLKRSPSDLDIAPMLDLIPHHASTDLNLTRASAELKNLFSNPGELSCEFPTVLPESAP